MLGKTAGGLYWMFRYLERSENTARLVESGFRIAMTRSSAAADEWAATLKTAGYHDAYTERYNQYDSEQAVNFLLRDPDHASSVMSVIEAARYNARLVRTALTREVWEATNECWMTLKSVLAKRVENAELPNVLRTIRQQSALVRGAMHGTMLLNESFDFARIGTFIERADNTARILDTRYTALLPRISAVGSPLDNVHWDTILRSVSALRAFRWLNEGKTDPIKIAELLILDRRLPRSLVFCNLALLQNLTHLSEEYGEVKPCLALAQAACDALTTKSIDSLYDIGLRPFFGEFIRRNNALGMQIETDYRFLG